MADHTEEEEISAEAFFPAQEQLRFVQRQVDELLLKLNALNPLVTRRDMTGQEIHNAIAGVLTVAANTAHALGTLIGPSPAATDDA